MIRRHGIFFVLILLILSVLSSPAVGQPDVTGYAQLTSSLDELVERQSLGLEALYFGGQGLLDTSRTSITPYVFVGGYDYEGIMTGLGASVQTEALLPFGVGLGFGLTDADFLTWVLALNGQKQVGLTSWSSMLLQGAVAYQRLTEGRSDYYSVWLDYAVWPETPEGQVLLEDLGWYTFYFHAVFEARWRFIKPLVDIGWLASRYSYTGYECEYDCFDPGQITSGDGTVTGGTFGFGLSLDANVLQMFGGIKWTDAGAIFPVSLTIRF
jgi:hypothetical protein